VKNFNLSKIACELLQLTEGWGNFVSDRGIIWRLLIDYKKEPITAFLLLRIIGSASVRPAL
jgi:hypothetical protein